MNVFMPGLMEYTRALALQERLFELRRQFLIEDCLILVEHPPVLTIGRSGSAENILIPQQSLEAAGVRVHHVSRGGDVTYHGPGQIVGYPIMDLGARGRDLRAFIEKIGEVFISLLDREFGIAANLGDRKYTGVWVNDDKITAIGIAARRWVTMHGFAFNVNTDLSHFKWINPCGITDRGVTSLEKLLGAPLDFMDMNRMVLRWFCRVFSELPEYRELSEIIKEEPDGEE